MTALQKLWNVVVVVLALNFIGLAVAAAMIAQRSDLDRHKLAQIGALLFDGQDADDEETQTDPEPETPPSAMEQLMALLDKSTGKPVEAYLEEVRESFDHRAAAIARARRELADRQRQVDAATQRLADERTAFDRERAAWEARIAATVAQAQDRGFRESLNLYEQMAPRQAKAVLLKLEDEVLLAYLRAMDTRQAGRILKEFKDDPETDRIRSILERLRLGEGVLGSASL